MNIPAATWGGLVVALVLGLFVLPPVARHVARLDEDPRTFRIVVFSGVLKLLSAPIWIYVIDHFYGGIADAYTYNRLGIQVAAQIRHGDFAFHVGRFIGDGATGIITGFIYTVIDSNTLGGFFVFAFISFISLVLFYRAFRVALPDGDRRRYAILVFFLPSLVFWTSAIGKDALISLGLGIAALGGARVLTRARGGFALLAAGLVFTTLIRPHVALMLFAAIAVAYPFTKARRFSPLTPIVKVLQVALLIVGGLVLARVTAHFFGLHSLSLHAIERVLKRNAANTGATARNQLGDFGSSGSTSTSLSPLALPRDFYLVIIRPLPFKAHGLTQLASSAENLFLLGLLAASWRRLVSALKWMRRRPYLFAAALYCIVWIVLFASVGNLGILARERTSMLPLLLVLVSWPARPGVAVDVEEPQPVADLVPRRSLAR